MAKNVDERNERASEPVTFELLFEAYSKFGPYADNDGDGILLSQTDLWMKQAKILCDDITLTDTGLLFNEFKKRKLSYHEFHLYLMDLCETKNLNVDDVKGKLFNAGTPTLAPKIV